MRLIFLTSSYPCFKHKKASSLVFAELLKAVKELGEDVNFITAACFNERDEETIKKLEKIGVNYLGDFSEHFKLFPKNKLSARFKILSEVLSKGIISGSEIIKPTELCRKLKNFQPDILIFFWDTYFERALPFLGDFVSVGYLAKPWWSASLTKIQSGLLGNKIKIHILEKFYQNERKKYFKRLKNFKKSTNIAVEDANECQEFGINCSYISNTWPDNFGSDWLKKRSRLEKENAGKINILANIGNLSATGNSYGLLFLAEEILPFLDNQLKGIDWQINICGAGKFAPAFSSKLEVLYYHPRVKIKGFVPDIEKEILASQIFLLLNNAGPYLGGYTRVIFGFSSGICLVAHQKLSASMPEVKNNCNALLGNDAGEILNLLDKACRSSDLRFKLGKQARRTYEEEYQPKAVARKIIKLCQEAIKFKG